MEGRKATVIEETVLAETLALRTILLNAFYKLAQGEKLTAEELQSFIDRADASKVQKAIEKLAAKPRS
jgi:predicted transcriptional regulator